MSKPAARGGSEPVILLGLRSPPVRDVPDGFAERSIGLYPGLFQKYATVRLRWLPPAAVVARRK